MKPELDPHATLTALLMASASPLLGQYAVILLAAIFGGLVALSWVGNITKREGAWFMFRSVAFATALTSISAELLSRRFNVPAAEFLFPASFLIASVGDKWKSLRDWGIELVQRGKKDV